MFQTFETATRPEDGPPRLAVLRSEMTREGLDGFIVPRADAHQGEYVAPHDERLSWLTGFTGSAGFCVALADQAGVFIDGRYRVQVKSQVKLDAFTPVHWPETQLADWLKGALPTGGKVGFDPWLHTGGNIEKARRLLDGSGITLIPTSNLIDRIWSDQPAPPNGKISAYPIEYSGETSADKRTRIAETLTDADQSATVLTQPDSIAWLLNIRGTDIERIPVPLAFAILHNDARVTLFTDPATTAEIIPHLGTEVSVVAQEKFEDTLKSLTGTVRLDKEWAPLALSDLLANTAWGDDPCRLPKACKNAVEIAGTQEAHLRDGAAMVEFLTWLDVEAPKGGLTEIDVVKKLEGFRRATNTLHDISFETISGAGPNGAIVHYRVTEDSNRAVKTGELLLVDSGGQYLDGTTDITRTVAVGQPSDEQRACFTRVLQGMIAISRARFPVGVAGAHLDALARAPLWMAGQDYDHGTGHGVGSFLSVHEGPQRLARSGDVPFKPGMIISNEPGYYREGAFGIRIENLLVVQTADDLAGADDRKMLDFLTLTFVPIDHSLINPNMLSGDERDWLNAYHAEVREKLSPRLTDAPLAWLEQATRPL